MTERTRSKTVTFQHPFRLSGADDLQPAGRYVVESDYETIEGLSFPAFRRVSTVIRLPGGLAARRARVSSTSRRWSWRRRSQETPWDGKRAPEAVRFRG